MDGSAVALDVPWFHAPLAVLDTETTGLSPETGDRIIEIAVIAFDGGQVVERWSRMLDPGAPLHPDVTRLTGIKQEDVDGQARFADIVHELLPRLTGRMLVAYNAGFDRNFLLHELSRAGAALPEGARWVDPLVFAKQLQKGQGNMKLGTVAKRLGVSLEEAHRAAADAECAGWVLLKLAELLPRSFHEVMDLHEKWEAEQEAERATWRSRQQRGGRATQPTGVAEISGPVNALGPSYAHGDELDPIRYLYLRAAGRA